MVTSVELIPMLSIQVLLLGAGMAFAILGSVRLALVAFRLPPSEFKTVFSRLSTALGFVGIIMLGFLLAVAYRIGGDNLGDTIGIITSVFGILGVAIVIHSFNFMAKFLTGGGEA